MSDKIRKYKIISCEIRVNLGIASIGYKTWENDCIGASWMHLKDKGTAKKDMSRIVKKDLSKYVLMEDFTLNNIVWQNKIHVVDAKQFRRLNWLIFKKKKKKKKQRHCQDKFHVWK